MGRTVWIVFNALNFGGNAVLGALEIDDTVVVLVTTANVPRCDATEVITSTCLRVLLDQRRVGPAFVQLLVHHPNVMTAAC